MNLNFGVASVGTHCVITTVLNKGNVPTHDRLVNGGSNVHLEKCGDAVPRPRKWLQVFRYPHILSIEQRFCIKLTQNRSFQRRSSQSVASLGTEKN